jgi:hypothetical protein
MCTRDKGYNEGFIRKSCKVTLAVMYLRQDRAPRRDAPAADRIPRRACPRKYQPLLRRLRVRHNTSASTSGGPAGGRRVGA